MRTLLALPLLPALLLGGCFTPGDFELDLDPSDGPRTVTFESTRSIAVGGTYRLRFWPSGGAGPVSFTASVEGDSLMLAGTDVEAQEVVLVAVREGVSKVILRDGQGRVIGQTSLEARPIGSLRFVPRTYAPAALLWHQADVWIDVELLAALADDGTQPRLADDAMALEVDVPEEVATLEPGCRVSSTEGCLETIDTEVRIIAHAPGLVTMRAVAGEGFEGTGELEIVDRYDAIAGESDVVDAISQRTITVCFAALRDGGRVHGAPLSFVADGPFTVAYNEEPGCVDLLGGDGGTGTLTVSSKGLTPEISITVPVTVTVPAP